MTALSLYRQVFAARCGRRSSLLSPGARVVFQHVVSLMRELLDDAGVFDITWAEGRITRLDAVIAGVQAPYLVDSKAQRPPARDVC
jgi:hypothetical protein